MTWCSSKYFSVDSRFYFGNPLPGEASPKLPRPFLIWEVWTVTFSQKLPVGTGEVTAKKSLTRPSLLVFLHAGLFLVKLSQKKVHWFWKNYEKLSPMNSSTTLQPTPNNICCTWMKDPRPYNVGISLPCSIVKSSIVVYLDTRIRSKSSVRPGCALDGSCKTAVTHYYITICGMY